MNKEMRDILAAIEPDRRSKDGWRGETEKRLAS